MEQEIWKDIDGYDGKYQVSNLGRIKSADYLWGNRRMKGRVFKLGNKKRYVNVALYKDDRRRDVNVHRLVAIAFIFNPENLPSVNHKNGNKLDNRVENLEWCTQKQNCQHAIQMGLRRALGSNHNSAKLSPEKVRVIRKRGISVSKLSRMYGVGETAIRKILYNKTWKHVV